MKRVYIVTGANGFLGNNIIRRIKLLKNDEIRALVRSKSNVDSLNGLNARIFVGDVTLKDSLESIFDVDNAEIIVIHCAAIVYIKDVYSKEVFDVNVNGTINVAKMCIKKNARLIYISTVHVIKEQSEGIIRETLNFNPDEVEGFYAKSKSLALKRVLEMSKSEGLNVSVIHPSGIIGPNDYGNSHLTNLILKVASNKLHFIVKGGYNFVDVRDVSDAVISAIYNAKKGECYIVSNRYASIKEICNIVCEYLNLKKVKIVPFSLALFGSIFCELYYNITKKTPLFTKYSLYTLKTNSNFSNEKAREELGFKPRDLEETVKDTVDFLKNINKL